MSVLGDPVLTLNRAWQPIQFLPVSTAITMVMRDMAAVLDTEHFNPYSLDGWIEFKPWDPEATYSPDQRWIKTPSSAIAVPDVILLKRYGERPPRNVNFNRDNLWKRDEYSCQYCGEKLSSKELQVEHVLPRSRGGPTSWENCVAACSSCNARKADLTPTEAGMPLKKRPTRPSWRPGLKIPRETMRPAWASFLAREAS